MKRNTINTLSHIMIWSTFFVLLMLFMPFYDMKPWLFFGMFGFLMGYYYLNNLILVPRFLAQKCFWQFFGITFVILLIYLYFSDLGDWLRPPFETIMPERMPLHRPDFGPDSRMLLPKSDDIPMFKPLLIHIPFNSLLTFLLVFMVSTGTKIIGSWFDTEQRRNQAEQEKSQAELSALKAQINPHFLFNTLNNLYHMSMQKSEETPDTILKLADLMRFVLTETQLDTIPLNKEIDVINQYIHLQKIRLTEKTTIDFRIKGDSKQHNIAPLLLLPFVENAFKYGVSTHTASTISIILTIENNGIIFNVKNKKMNTNTTNTGTGLQNVKRRLQLTYPNQHILKTRITQDDYTIHLTIKEL
ncbi:sensor histidine kinase [Geofilum sp. OHC36d9]|uniref:sensor histidine kinase n=1 Tax=Geofilum sp. OHC36d9 TaxID=3458413 RepID=UPI004033DFD5